MFKRSICLAAVAALAMSGAAWAHHSHANYKTNEWMNLSGKVTEVHWMNPHVWVYMEVTDAAGVAKTWALEGGSIGALIRGGWTKESVKVGDTIQVRCHHLKDNSDGCLLGFLTTPGSAPKEFD